MVAVVAESYPPPLRRDGRRWAASVSLIAFTIGLVALRGIVPDWMSVLGPHLGVVGLAGIHHCLRRFQGLPPRLGWVYLPVPVAIASAAFFYFVVPHFGLRQAVLSAVGAVQAGACGEVLLRRGGPAPRTSRLAAAVFLCCSGLLLARAGATLRIGPRATPQVYLQQSLLGAAVFVALLVGYFVMSFSFAVLCNEKLNADLVRQATRDALTGCFNRGAIAEIAARAAAGARRHGNGLAIAIVDLDSFKAINDRHGHDAGDAALRQVAAALQASVRHQDVVGRYGGDEFVLVMPETAAEEAGIVCQRVQAALRAAGDGSAASRLATRASVGVAAASGAGADVGVLLAAADAAMYAVKAAGGDGVRLSVVEAANGLPPAPTTPVPASGIAPARPPIAVES